MKKEGKKVIALYIIAVIVYGMVASLFTSTVHIDVDEELYVALAKSFHYRGEFAFGDQLLDYNCVLYSMLISLAYYFYTPETILFTMRMIGVITMCSSVFPIFLLAKNMLGNDRKALLFCGFMMIMPYMFDSAYLMQEVLSYPLFMWTLYVLYLFFEKGVCRREGLVLAAGAGLSVLCVFTKTYMFFIPVIVNICSLYGVLRGKEGKKYLAGTMVYDVVYLLLFAGMYFMIFAINGFRQGSNHYASQFSHLFPIGLDTVVYGLAGCVFYGAFLVVNTGVLPVGAVIGEWRDGKEKAWSLIFLSASGVFLIVEIVFMIVLTEEGTGTLPHKFLFRYFQIFVPLILLMFMKAAEGKTAFLQSRNIRGVMWGSLWGALLYFVGMKGETRQAIIDGHFFLFMENVTKYIIPYGDAVMVLLLMGALGLVPGLCGKREGNISRIMKTGVAGVALFWIVEAVQLPYYTNTIAQGKVIQEDSIKIAEYLNGQGYEYICYVYEKTEEKGSCQRNFYGYVKQPYQIVSKDDIPQIMKEKNGQKVALIFPVKSEAGLEGWTEVKLDTETLVLLTL